MKSILALFLLHIAFISNSIQSPEYVPQIMLKSSVKNTKLQSNEAVYVFEFIGDFNKNSEIVIMYSIDNVNGTQKLDAKNQLSIKSTPGSHIFQFYYNHQYEEVYTDSLAIKPHHVNTYEVQLYNANYPIQVEKPVIYLYPEKEITFKLSVKPKGTLAFTYPTYNEFWKGIALPNGDILINKEMYNYLFWEADQTITSEIINSREGSIVSGADATSFLSNQLNSFGLNSKEKADFITFWGPKLTKNEFNYVCFVMNEDADYFGELNITPRPDNVYRLYILTCPIKDPNQTGPLQAQEIKPISRNGFTVIEWGGSEIDPQMIEKNMNL